MIHQTDQWLLLPQSSTLTVAGAVPDFHGIPEHSERKFIKEHLQDTKPESKCQARRVRNEFDTAA
jgi:hypothetical protein